MVDWPFKFYEVFAGLLFSFDLSTESGRRCVIVAQFHRIKVIISMYKLCFFFSVRCLSAVDTCDLVRIFSQIFCVPSLVISMYMGVSQLIVTYVDTAYSTQSALVALFNVEIIQQRIYFSRIFLWKKMNKNYICNAWISAKDIFTFF